MGLGVLLNRDNTVCQAGGFIIQLMPYTESRRCYGTGVVNLSGLFHHVPGGYGKGPNLIVRRRRPLLLRPIPRPK